MLQRIAYIASIGSFLLGVWVNLADKPDWQRNILFGFGAVCLVAAIVSRFQSPPLRKPPPDRRESKELDMLEGTQILDWSGDFEIHYPKPFRRIPHLQLEVVSGIASYKVVEQRTDGFKLNVTSRTSHELRRGPVIKWRAPGNWSSNKMDNALLGPTWTPATSFPSATPPKCHVWWHFAKPEIIRNGLWGWEHMLPSDRRGTLI